MAAVCDSPKQTLVAPVLGSHFRLAQQAIVAIEVQGIHDKAGIMNVPFWQILLQKSVAGFSGQ